MESEQKWCLWSHIIAWPSAKPYLWRAKHTDTETCGFSFQAPLGCDSKLTLTFLAFKSAPIHSSNSKHLIIRKISQKERPFGKRSWLSSLRSNRPMAPLSPQPCWGPRCCWRHSQHGQGEQMHLSAHATLLLALVPGVLFRHKLCQGPCGYGRTGFSASKEQLRFPLRLSGSIAAHYSFKTSSLCQLLQAAQTQIQPKVDVTFVSVVEPGATHIGSHPFHCKSFYW